MSSSSGIRAIRQVRRKKSSLSEVKIAVVGAPGVGKSGKDDIRYLSFFFLLFNISTINSFMLPFRIYVHNMS